MIDLLNDLTLIFVWLIHNFELKMVDLKFRLLPTLGSTVTTGLGDWVEFSVVVNEASNAYSSIIGKSKDEVWSLILSEWNKYLQYILDIEAYAVEYESYETLFAQWQIDVQSDAGLVAPDEPDVPVRAWTNELTTLFEYINSVGVK